MGSTKDRYYYWDSCVFLAYLNGEPERAGVIEDLFENIRADDKQYVLTSTLSIVEVAHVISEKRMNQLQPDVEERIDALWQNSTVRLVEPHVLIMQRARQLIRVGIEMKWTIKPPDAVHLATADWVNKQVGPVIEWQSYDGVREKCELLTGIRGTVPNVLQPRLIRHDEKDTRD